MKDLWRAAVSALILAGAIAILPAGAAAQTEGGTDEGYVTTHVLDTERGRPAAGMEIELFRIEGDERTLVRTVTTNADGRTDAPVIPEGELEAGVWELVFHAGDYLDGAGSPGESPRFLDLIPIRFGIAMRASTTTYRFYWRRTATRRIEGAEGRFWRYKRGFGRSGKRMEPGWNPYIDCFVAFER